MDNKEFKYIEEDVKTVQQCLSQIPEELRRKETIWDSAIILIKRDDVIIVTTINRLNEEFNTSYATYGGKSSRMQYFYQQFGEECLNGDMDFDSRKDKIVFEYEDSLKASAYAHIKFCVNSKYCLDSDMGMFYTLLALQSVGAITEDEYDVLHDTFCKY